MQQLFMRANEALLKDLNDYAAILREVVATLPTARALCERVVREARLIQALLAFSDGVQAAELSRIVLHLGNLWAVRDDRPPRSSGFSEEIAESQRAREEALHGLSLVAGGRQDPISAELQVCFKHVLTYLHEQEQQLERCHALLQPFRTSPELTRKRLNLLVAAAEARLPDTPERRAAVQTYLDAAALIAEWEGGVALDERSIAVLDRCLTIIGQSSAAFGVLTVPVGDAWVVDAG